MAILETRVMNKTKNSTKNSYYDKIKPYTQYELDEYRISEGYSREKLFNSTIENMQPNNKQNESNKCKKLVR